MNKTSFALAAFVASLSLVFATPASYAESKATPNASYHACKKCSHDKKCDTCDACKQCNPSPETKKNKKDH